MVKTLILGFVFIGLSVCYSSQSSANFSTSFYCIDVTGKIESCLPPQTFSSHQVAHVRYVNRINETGWAELDLITNPSLPDSVQAYYAGYLEGFLTAPLINSIRMSSEFGVHADHQNAYCRNITQFVLENLNFTIEKIHQADGHHQESAYWHEVGLTLYQIAGLDDGYTHAQGKQSPSAPHLNIDPCGNFMLNLMTEYDDLEEIKHRTHKDDRETHCSALIKYFPETGEVLTAQNTWASYNHMLRILKKYTLNYKTSEAKSVVMSSYPGIIFSHDDFYITSAKLVVQETSIDNFNNTAWEGLYARDIVFEFIRNAVANRLASTGYEWAHWFSLHNSGTYNNQFMIVDYKQMLNKTGLGHRFLTVLEQMPHYIHFEDMTDHLRKHSYWASYNVPYFKDIYVRSGFDKIFSKRGDHYSYEHTARARIFARDQGKVHNVSSLYHLMRYNDYKNDPLARCNCTPSYSAEYGIAARADLNEPKGKYPFYDLTFRASGATDAKVTSTKLVDNLEFVAVSGPTDEQQPPFDWDKFSDKTVLHFDQPKVWQFKPVLTKWSQTTEQGFPEFKFDF